MADPLDSFKLEVDPTLALEHQALRDALAYWDKKRGGRAMPTRADIDPLELREHLGYLMILGVEPGPRFRFRLIGTKLTEAVGRDMTGRYYDEVYPAAYYDRVTQSLRWVAENGKPCRVSGTLWHARREWLHFESLDMPLSNDGTTVDAVFSRVALGE